VRINLRKNKIKPSQTALKVALNIIALGNVPELKEILPKGIVNATSELLSASGATSQRRIDKHHSPKIITLYKNFDWLLPGQFEAFGYRKAYCEKSVIDAINNEASQVLVLGAGYDTMAYRLSLEYPNINFFEIDKPITANSKIKGLEKMGKATNHFIIPEDLSKKSLVDVLENTSFWQKENRTIVTAEGLLQYLNPESVVDLFEECNLVTSRGSRIAFTYIMKGTDGRPNAGPRTGIVLWFLKAIGEPWLWAPGFNELKKLLTNTGWEYSDELVGRMNKRGVEYFACAIK